MTLQQDFPMVFDWARILFIENPGMAFGLELGGDYGKLALTLFRIVAVVVIGVILRKVVKGKYSTLLIISLALIMAGAIGNIIDSIFYGVIFSKSTATTVAEFMPEISNNTGWFRGKVVDMFYFPIIEDARFPSWIPFFGGDTFTFFRPVFNIADSAITIGIMLILLFQRSLFSDDKEPATDPDTQSATIANSSPTVEAVEETASTTLESDTDNVSHTDL